MFNGKLIIKKEQGLTIDSRQWTVDFVNDSLTNQQATPYKLIASYHQRQQFLEKAKIASQP